MLKIAPKYHLKAAVLDAIGVALLLMFCAALGAALFILSVPS